MDNTRIYNQHATGELAYIDTLWRGLVPCKVLAIDKSEHGQKLITVIVTATRNAYHKGETGQFTTLQVVPRDSVYRSRQHCGQLRIRNDYEWVEKE